MITSNKYDLAQLGIDTSTARLVDNDSALRSTCPKCSANRSTEAHRRELVFWLSLVTGCYKCHHCGWEGRLDTREYLERQRAREERKSKARQMAERQQKTARQLPPPLPQPANAEHPFSASVEKYLTETRRLPLDVLQRASVAEAMAWMPQTKHEERCIVFQYIEQGFVVNRKYRDAQKNFRMEKGCEQLPYNVDSCLGQQEVIVTEGEFDALSFMAAGFESVVSIPDGANAKTGWMNRFFELYFEDKTTVYVATDMDAPGEQAAQELIRRFGPEVCRRVRFSEGCKDANEELVRHGAEELAKRVSEAQSVPLPDVSLLEDFEEQLDHLYAFGPTPGQKTGWNNLDELVSFAPGQLALITGRTNDGKSEWLDELVVRLMIRSGWNAAFWSPENTLLDHSRKLIEKLAGLNFEPNGSQLGLQPDDFGRAKQWLRERVSWVTLPFDQLSLDNILGRSLSLVRRRGIRVLVLDPFNFIGNEAAGMRSENAVSSEIIGRIRQFAIRHDLLVFLVAHPRKVEMQIDGNRRRITIEDIAGTADFGNKADYCFCVDRDDKHGYVTIFIDKVRRKQYGSKGRRAHFVYNLTNGRYAPTEVDTDSRQILRTNNDESTRALI